MGVSGGKDYDVRLTDYLLHKLGFRSTILSEVNNTVAINTLRLRS